MGSWRGEVGVRGEDCVGATCRPFGSLLRRLPFILVQVSPVLDLGQLARQESAKEAIC